MLLGDRKIKLLVPSFCLSGRQLEGARRAGGAAAAVIKQSMRLDSNPWHVLQGAAGSETPAQPTLFFTKAGGTCRLPFLCLGKLTSYLVTLLPGV